MKVLIITSSIDYTVDYIISKYTDVDFYRVNVDLFGNYQFMIGNDGWTIQSNTGCISVDDVSSIYYRKPLLPNLSEFSPSYHNMIERDILGTINGIVDSFEGLVISKPHILRRVENKIYQLQALKNLHIPFPNSLIGNILDMDRQILSKSKIIKPLSIGKIEKETEFEVFQTNILQNSVGDISLTPIYLQEEVQKDFEVRITCIDHYIWAVGIDTNDRIDWRRTTAQNTYYIVDTPIRIRHMCISILQFMGLRFGAFDFIVRPDGEWIFLEVNPNGQWLWLEKILNLDISKKLVMLLNSEEGTNEKPFI